MAGETILDRMLAGEKPHSWDLCICDNCETWIKINKRKNIATNAVNNVICSSREEAAVSGPPVKKSRKKKQVDLQTRRKKNVETKSPKEQDKLVRKNLVKRWKELSNAEEKNVFMSSIFPLIWMNAANLDSLPKLSAAEKEMYREHRAFADRKFELEVRQYQSDNFENDAHFKLVVEENEFWISCTDVERKKLMKLFNKQQTIEMRDLINFGIASPHLKSVFNLTFEKEIVDMNLRIAYTEKMIKGMVKGESRILMLGFLEHPNDLALFLSATIFSSTPTDVIREMFTRLSAKWDPVSRARKADIPLPPKPENKKKEKRLTLKSNLSFMIEHLLREDSNLINSAASKRAEPTPSNQKARPALPVTQIVPVEPVMPFMPVSQVVPNFPAPHEILQDDASDITDRERPSKATINHFQPLNETPAPEANFNTAFFRDEPIVMMEENNVYADVHRYSSLLSGQELHFANHLTANEFQQPLSPPWANEPAQNRNPALLNQMDLNFAGVGDLFYSANLKLERL